MCNKRRTQTTRGTKTNKRRINTEQKRSSTEEEEVLSRRDEWEKYEKCINTAMKGLFSG